MTSRTLRPPLLALALLVAGGCALLLGAPAQGQAPAKAAIVAYDNLFRTIGGSAPNVTILAGGHVDFSYPEGSSKHNVHFTAKEPSVCGISQGSPAASASALPSSPAGPLWEGGCDFADTGSYPFICDLHPSTMTGSVTVVAASTAPPPPPPPPPAAVASFLRLASPQTGTAVRGSVRVRSAGSRLLARAFARRGALSGGRSTTLVGVGRQLRTAVPSGRVAFRVPLTAVGRRALRRNGRLAITMRLTVTPPGGGTSYTATRTVILRAPA